MIGLDTNVIVRFLTQDDAVQSRAATRVIENTLSELNMGFVSLVAMVETAWVLDRSYGFASPQIAGAIESMLATSVLVVENEQEVFAAMIALKSGRAQFADALIGELGAKAGCAHTLTFDRSAASLPHFCLL